MMDTDRASELRGFRLGLHGTFTKWADALLELKDALVCSPGSVRSIPGLSPSSRSSPAATEPLHKALDQGRVDEEALQRLLVEHREPDWPLVFAVDASTWARCDAECSPERGFYCSACKHSAGQPIVAGCSYQWINQLAFTPDSWSAPMDVRRLPLDNDATSVTIEQVRRLVGLLPSDGEVPLFVFDAGYDPAGLSHGLGGVRAEVLVRIAETRVFHPDPPERSPGTNGRPRRHGERFVLSDPSTWTAPGATCTLSERRYGTITVSAWHELHPKLHGRGRWKGAVEPPIVRASVLRVEVEHLPKATARGKKTLWLWWSGQGEPDLKRCVLAYLRRFDIEHGFRFKKGTLAWTTPALCTPEQADRWTRLVAAAFTELGLARGLVDDLRLPWEKPCDPARLTPARVRRGFWRLRATLGTPALPPKATTPWPGRPKGTKKPPRTRYPAVKRAA